MGETEGKNCSLAAKKNLRKGLSNAFNPAFCKFFVHLPNKLQNGLQSQLKRLARNEEGVHLVSTDQKRGNISSIEYEVNLDKQMQAWRENPLWTDQSAQIKVSVPKGSFCNLNVKFNVGLPPDAVYNIVTDPDNKRVFKNIKEVISRKVLVDEGLRQVVEVEQAAIWRFLCWSGTISIRVLVDQNREDYTMKFKQIQTGFMKTFEGCWKVEPLFIDDKMCSPFKPKTWKDYNACTGGKGRLGSQVSLEQVIQPAIIPPPPISWYLRGITSRTTEMLIHDLLAEASRIRGGLGSEVFQGELPEKSDHHLDEMGNLLDIKGRWARRIRTSKRHQKRLSAAKLS